MIIKVINELPKIILYEDVFTDEEIEDLSFENLEFKQSLVRIFDTDQFSTSHGRTNKTARLSDDKSKFIQKRVISIIDNNLQNISIDHYEPASVQRYISGQQYVPHYDFSNPINSNKNLRIATAIIYLNDNFTGGATRFPFLGKVIKPKKGSVLFFQYNYDNITNSLSYHGGDTVTSKTKYIVTVWIRRDPINDIKNL